MTTEPNNHENDVVDELFGRWCDSETEDLATVRCSADAHASFDSTQIRRAAQLQLVHSLLFQLADRDRAAKERQIQDLLQKIDTDTKTSGTYYRITRPLARYGVAAVFILSLTLLFVNLRPNTAMAAIDQMVTAIDYARDRTYSIMVQDNQRDRRPPPREDRSREPRRQPQERAGLDGATLYLRGSDKFVLSQQTPSGKTVISGSDGQTRWLIRPEKPVLVSSNPEAFRIPMPPELAAILSFDLKATLLHIRSSYQVKYLKDVPDAQKQVGAWHYLDARKIDDEFPGPKNIEIWADIETGLLIRLEFADVPIDDDPAPKRLIIELKNQNQLPDDWFTRQAHHSQDSEVDFLPE